MQGRSAGLEIAEGATDTYRSDGQVGPDGTRTRASRCMAGPLRHRRGGRFGARMFQPLPSDRPGAPADPGDPARVRLSAEASASQGRDHLWFRTESPLGTVFVAHCDGWVSGLRIATDSTWAAHVEAKLPSWTPVDTGSFATFMRNTDIMHKRLRP